MSSFIVSSKTFLGCISRLIVSAFIASFSFCYGYRQTVQDQEMQGYWSPKRCYSCMSTSYGKYWNQLRWLYFRPTNFTDGCDYYFDKYRVGTVSCPGPCIILREDEEIGGMVVGQRYIRGCFNKILKNGFNESAIRTHRFRYDARCRSLDRNKLFRDTSSASLPSYVTMCTCLGDLCNTGSYSKNTASSLTLFYHNTLSPSLVLLLYFYTRDRDPSGQ